MAAVAQRRVLTSGIPDDVWVSPPESGHVALVYPLFAEPILPDLLRPLVASAVGGTLGMYCPIYAGLPNGGLVRMKNPPRLTHSGGRDAQKYRGGLFAVDPKYVISALYRDELPASTSTSLNLFTKSCNRRSTSTFSRSISLMLTLSSFAACPSLTCGRGSHESCQLVVSWPQEDERARPYLACSLIPQRPALVIRRTDRDVGAGRWGGQNSSFCPLSGLMVALLVQCRFSMGTCETCL